MLRPAIRASRRALRPTQPLSIASPSSRRFIGTAPAQKKYTWKGAAFRWGLAGAALYWYNTSPYFADELPVEQSTAPVAFAANDAPTVDAIIEDKRRQLDEAQARRAAAKTDVKPELESPKPQSSESPTQSTSSSETATESPEALEEEASSQGAFNEETGEINWDCPCLGGMAHGPCGEDFRTAFSCFVFSKEEPKGMDCIDKFQTMQDCFRKYPEIYGAEIEDDEAGNTEVAEAQASSPDSEKDDHKKEAAPEVTSPSPGKVETEAPKTTDAPSDPAPPPLPAGVQEKVEEARMSTHDATGANAGVAARK